MKIRYVDASTGQYVHWFNKNSDWSNTPSDWYGELSVSQNTLSIGGNYAGEMSTTYDVTLHNGGATFASLSTLLADANLNTLIPLAVRKGGMSIKFVCSSDNKYVQARCMAQNFTTDVTQWQGVDDVPTAGSDNLVKSKGVQNELDAKVDKIHSSNLIDPSKLTTYSFITSGGSISPSPHEHYCISDKIPVVVDGVGKDVISNAIAYSYARAWVVYDANGNKLRWSSEGEVQYTYQDGDDYIILGLNSDRGTAYANYGTVLIQEKYTDYLPVAQIEKRVDDLEVDKFNKSDIVQQIGDNTDKVMSQKAVTKELSFDLVDFPSLPSNTKDNERMDSVYHYSSDDNYRISIYDLKDFFESKINITGHLSNVLAYIAVKDAINNIGSTSVEIYNNGGIEQDIDISFIATDEHRFLWISELKESPMVIKYSPSIKNKVEELSGDVDALLEDTKSLSDSVDSIKEDIYIESLDIKIYDSIIQPAYITSKGTISTTSIEAYKLKVFSVTANKKYAIVSKDSRSASPSKIVGFTEEVPGIGVVLSLITDDYSIPSGERVDYTPLKDGYIVLYYRKDFYDLYELKQEFPLYESGRDDTPISYEVIPISYITNGFSIGSANPQLTHYQSIYFPVKAGNKYYLYASRNVSTGADALKICGFSAESTPPAVGTSLTAVIDESSLPSGYEQVYIPEQDGWLVVAENSGVEPKPLLLYNSVKKSVISELEESVDELEQDVQDLTDRVDAISVNPIDTAIVTPTTVYSICESKDIDKNMTAVLYADHFVSTNPNSRPRFKSTNNDKLLVFSPINERRNVFNEGVDKYTHNLQDSIAGGIKEKSFSIQHRSILNSVTKNLNIRILCIGDSVTNGTGANFPTYITGEKKLYNYPTYLKKMSLLDHDLYNEGFQLTSIGRNTRYAISHNGQTIPVWAEGRGGWQVAEYCFCKDATEAEGNNYVNYFYDANKVWQNEDLNTVTYTNSKGTFTGVKFSLQSYLNKYKTLADDGVTRLVVGSTAGTEVTDVNAYDVCTPNVVVIQLCHNGAQSNFEKYIDYLIAAIKEEFSDMPIIISLIDTVGTYNPELYPEFDKDCIDMHSSHNRFWSLVAKHKQLENEANGIYIAWNMFIQPTAYSIPTRLLKQPESLSMDIFDNFSKTGAGYYYHPGTLAHAAWAYQLYAMAKWILL